MPKNRRRALGAIAAVVLCLGAAAPAHAADAVQPPSRLTVEQQAQPLAVENLDSPPLGWALGDNRDGAQQTAYEIRVGTAPGAADTWASGKVESSASANVPYAGPALKSSQRYWWSVRTWDAAGQAGPWSAPANFGTAVKSDWAGTPIWAPGRDTTGWTDYGVDVDFTVTAVARGRLLPRLEHEQRVHVAGPRLQRAVEPERARPALRRERDVHRSSRPCRCRRAHDRAQHHSTT